MAATCNEHRARCRATLPCTGRPNLMTMALGSSTTCCAMPSSKGPGLGWCSEVEKVRRTFRFPEMRGPRLQMIGGRPRCIPVASSSVVGREDREDDRWVRSQPGESVPWVWAGGGPGGDRVTAHGFPLPRWRRRPWWSGLAEPGSPADLLLWRGPRQTKRSAWDPDQLAPGKHVHSDISRRVPRGRSAEAPYEGAQSRRDYWRLLPPGGSRIVTGLTSPLIELVGSQDNVTMSSQGLGPACCSSSVLHAA